MYIIAYLVKGACSLWLNLYIVLYKVGTTLSHIVPDYQITDTVFSFNKKVCNMYVITLGIPVKFINW